MTKQFVLPTDYGCMALVNPQKYQPFIGDDWDADKVVSHIASQPGRIFAWGCSYGNWQVVVADHPVANHYCRTTSGFIVSDGHLYLANYDILTEAAQIPSTPIVPAEMEEFLFPWPSGTYNCTVKQLFYTERAQGDGKNRDAWQELGPHYAIELISTKTPSQHRSLVDWYPIFGHL